MTNKKIFVWLILVFILISTAFAQNKTVNLASIFYPPYYGPDMQNGGFITEIIREAFKEKGYTVNVDFMQWSDALDKSKNGEYDGLYTLWYRKDREQWFVYSDALPPNDAVFCRLKNNYPETYRDYDDVKDYKIGIVKDYTYPDDFYNAALDTIVGKDDKEILGMLFSGIVDLIIMDRAQATYITRQYYPGYESSLYCFENTVKTEYQHIGFSKNATDYQEKLLDFNSGLKAIISDGRYDAILDKHGYEEFSLLSLGDDTEKEKIVFKSATELNYPPFSTPTSIQDTADGFSVELLRAALNSVGYNVSFYVGPWSEIKEDLTNGDIDVLPLVGRTPERENIYDFTVPYITLRGAVFVRQEDISKIKTLDDLKDKEILVMKGDNAEEYAIRNILSSNIISVDSYEDAFDLLSKGKYDAVIVQKLVGLQLIDKSQIKNIVAAFEISDFKQYFTFAVTEGNSELLTILNEGLSKIKIDGTFDIIYDRWLGDILKSEASSITEQNQLDKITENSIISKSRETALQIDEYLKNNPDKTIKDLQNDSVFQKIALQNVGESGYTSVIDVNSGNIYFHPQDQLINTDSHLLKDMLPGFWAIFDVTIGDTCKESSGYYYWEEEEGQITEKFMHLSCVETKTSDNKALFVAATTYLSQEQGEIYVEKYNIDSFSEAKERIKQKAIDVAKQVEIYIRSNPEKTIKDLQNDSYFQEISVQKVGKTGYTAVSDYDSLVARFHANPEIVDLELSSLATKLPGFWDIMKKTKGGREAEGIYDWEEPDGSIRKKYMYIAIVDEKTADNIGLHVAATTYLDEYDVSDLASTKEEEKLESDILSILLRNSGYTFIFIIIIFSILYFLTLSLKEKYKGISLNFKIINILTIIFIISFFTEKTALNSVINLYASRLAHVTALLIVLILSMISLIISLKKPIKKKLCVLIYIFFSIVSILILFTGYFEKEVIVDPNNPSLSESVFGELYFTYPIIMLIIILLPVFFLIRSYIETRSKILLHFIYVYCFFSLLIIFEVISITVLNINSNSLLMITPFLINIGLYWIFLKNKIFYERKTNILIILIFIGFVFMISLFLLNTFQATKNMRENELMQINQKLQSVAKSRADHVETYLNQNIERFKLITSKTKLRDNINLFNKENKQENLDIITKILIDAKAPIDEFERLCIIDTNGIVIASTDNDFIEKDVHDKEFFMSGLISEKVFLVEEDNNLKLFVSGPFILDGEVVGVGLSVVKIDYLNSIIAENTGFGETEEIYIVNNEGYMITPSRFMEFKDFIFKQKIPNENTKKCWPDNKIDKEDKENFIVKDYRNITVINAQSHMQDMDWCLLAEEDYDEAVSVVENSIRQIWSFTFFMIFLMVVIGIVFSFIITRSLRFQIKEKTSEITNINKNLEKTVHERTKELEDLNRNLEKKVKQRTKELEEKVDELENTKIAIMNILEDADSTNKDLMEARQELQKKVKELKLMDKKKDEFISVTAHELKTPLTSIRGFTDLLNNPKVLKDRKKLDQYVEIIIEETKRLERLVSDILDLSRLDLGTMKFDFEKVSIKEIMDDLKNDCSIEVKNKGLKFITKVKGKISEFYTDEYRVLQVLNNLIRNAIKYTNKGHIKVEAFKKGNYLHFIVEDTGTGILKKEHKRIFDRFYQVDSSYTRKVGGSGLGLAISQGIVNTLDGKIRVKKSEEGKGTTFEFKIKMYKEPPKKEKIQKNRKI